MLFPGLHGSPALSGSSASLRANQLCTHLVFLPRGGKKVQARGPVYFTCKELPWIVQRRRGLQPTAPLELRVETVCTDTGTMRQTLQTWLCPSSQALTASILGTSPPSKQRRANAPPPSTLLSKANPFPCTQRNTGPRFTKGFCLYLLLNSPQIINQRGHGGLVPTAQLQTPWWGCRAVNSL